MQRKQAPPLGDGGRGFRLGRDGIAPIAAWPRIQSAIRNFPLRFVASARWGEINKTASPLSSAILIPSRRLLSGCRRRAGDGARLVLVPSGCDRSEA
jgi:hypothetical protein